MYKIHQRYIVEARFKKLFGFSFIPFYDHNLTILFRGIIKIDIYKFNQEMNIPDGISVSEFILKQYGKEALNFIKKLL